MADRDRSGGRDRREDRSGDGDDRRSYNSRGRGGGGGRRRRRVCQFCVDQSESIDYKDGRLLQQFVSRSGSISPRRRTGTCARHQRMLAQAIKRARHIALLPFVSGQS